MQPDRPDRAADSRTGSRKRGSSRSSTWPRRVFSATVDQFLAFLQHDYGSTCLLPLLADSAIVLDEVHSYDRGMFTAPAAVPGAFRRACPGHDGHDDGAPQGRPGQAPHGRQRPRLRRATTRRSAADLRPSRDHVVSPSMAPTRPSATAPRPRLRSGKRILWVGNTVDRARGPRPRTSQTPTRGQDALANRSGRTDPLLPQPLQARRPPLPPRRGCRGVQPGPRDRGGCRPGGHDPGLRTLARPRLRLARHRVCPVSALIQRLGRCCRDQPAHEAGASARW